MSRPFLDDIFHGLAILTILLAAATKAHGDTIVHVLNGLPKGSQALQNDFKSNDTSIPIIRKIMGAGEEYHWKVEGGVEYTCFSVWTSNFQKWTVFEPRRDQNHADVFWVVKEDGFYRSWDNKTWVKKAEWESE
ncbi:hypothetical protein MANES_15G049200v8 [Manihot esculenta]|uniref:S-protein homolog n=1 Tax=Manihot esculenta TaxID=3983 RepID=A0A2C9UD92_MANES|nr:hypothetical protein MANES_15G049200v8 [Manihot esculenta]